MATAPSAELPRALRQVCGHDSRSVDGCLHCEAADAIEQRSAVAAALQAQPAVPAGWRIETGVGGFSEKGDRWVCVRNLESQCGQDFYEDRDLLMFSFLSALAATPAAPAAPPAPKTLDDPRLQGLFSAAIDGALTYGYQGVNPAPAGHWLEQWWQKGRNVALAEAAASSPAPAASQEPAGWFEAPYGEFRVNPDMRLTFPQQSLKWAIPLYLGAPPAPAPAPALPAVDALAGQADSEQPLGAPASPSRSALQPPAEASASIVGAEAQALLLDLWTYVHSVVIRADSPQNTKFWAHVGDLKRRYEQLLPRIELLRAAVARGIEPEGRESAGPRPKADEPGPSGRAQEQGQGGETK